MLCVMQVLDEFEAKEATKVVSFHKCIKQVLEEFPDVMCRNHNFGFITKAKGLQGCGPRGSPRVNAKGSPRVKARGSPRVKARGSPKVKEEARKSRQEEARESHHIFPGV